MRTIKIKTRPSNLGWHFKISLTHENGFFEFNVTMDRDFYSRLSTTSQPEVVCQICFEFLLEKEPPTAIMREFDIATVSGFFPDFMGEIEKRLGNV